MLKNWIIAVAGACAFFAVGVVLDGPSDSEMARLIAQDKEEAEREASVAYVRLERCRALRGPRAEVVLAGVNGQDFVCKVRN